MRIDEITKDIVNSIDSFQSLKYLELIRDCIDIIESIELTIESNKMYRQLSTEFVNTIILLIKTIDSLPDESPEFPLTIRNELSKKYNDLVINYEADV